MSVGHKLNLKVEDIYVRVTAKYSTEAVAAERTAAPAAFAVEVSLESEEPPQILAGLIKEAEATCYTIAALRAPSPVELSATVNGERFNFGDRVIGG